MSEDTLEKNRKSSLFKMAAKVALKQSKNLVARASASRLKNMVSQAQIVVDHVGQLKGAAMKAVQMITIEARDFLPPEVLSILEKLQSQSPPLSNTQMLGVLRSELGEEKYEAIQDLEPTPLAAASIGQVYRGKLDQDQVVFKVQYPGVAESVDEDIATLKKLVKGLLFVSRKKIDIDALFKELLRVIKLETDYEHELEMLNKYKRMFTNRPGYVVPKSYPNYSTQKVLTAQFLAGDEFPLWLAKGPSRERKEKLGRKLLDLFQIEFFENRTVQTDSNPANFLVDKDDRLVLLDFGATIVYDEDFAHQYTNLLNSFFTHQDDAGEQLESFGFIDPRESPAVKKQFLDFISVSLTPFLPSNQPFDFAGEAYVSEVRQKAISFTKNLKYSAPPQQIIFLHRKLGGIFQLLRMLEVRMDLTPFRDHVIRISEPRS